jgi:hypothetical protein
VNRTAFLCGVTAAAVLASAAPAAAQTFTATNLENSGAGSLRAAVEAANAAPGADTVGFAAGLSGTIHLSGSGLSIKESVAIEGPGAAQLTVEQTSKEHRVIKIEEPAASGQVKLSGLHLTGGRIKGEGGDVYDDATNAALTIEGCLIADGNTEGTGYGGGVSANAAPLVVRDSTFAEDQAVSGGAIWGGGDHGQTVTIEGSTFAGDTAEEVAGAVLIEAEESGLEQIVDSTFVGDRSEGRAGAVYISAGEGAAALIADSTFTGNQSVEEGGALDLEGGDLAETVEDSTIAGNQVTGSGKQGGGISFGDIGRLVDTIVAGNSAAAGPDLRGKALASFDLIGNPAGAELAELVPGSDLLGVDPQLGPLAANGGPTETMALPPTSPAVNKGGGALAVDQRGDARPVIYPGVALSGAPGANGADIGAYELAAPPASAATPPPSGTNPPPLTKGRSSRPPRIRVSCPASTKPTGCRFSLQVFSTKPHPGKGKRADAMRPVAESLVTTANLRPGKSAEPTLTPKPKFAGKLDAARSLLVRETATIGGKRSVSYRRMKVVG